MLDISIFFKKMKKRNFFENGFTLVELLIVIALIAILSVAVLATINPIEQTNKARDSKFKNDAAEVLSAYERFYVSRGNYPWGDAEIGVGNTIGYGVGGTFLSSSPQFGVIAASVGTTGILIRSDELKSSFIGKDPWLKLDNVALEDRMIAITDGSSTNYVCFCPKAVANRKDALKMKCISVSSTAAQNKALPVSTTCVQPTDPRAADFCSAQGPTKANVMCVPE